MESLYVGQRQIHSALALIRPLRDQRRGHSVLIQVEVADVAARQNTAAEADSLTGGEDSVRGQQGEGGNWKGTC